MGLLTGKKAIVTGAGRGIGSAIALRLALEGAEVAITYRGSLEGAEATATRIRDSGGSAITLQADLNDALATLEMVRSAHQRMGGLDFLINNASGFGAPARLKDAGWEVIAQEYAEVVRPTIHVTGSALPILLDQKSGKIVNLAATLLQRPAEGYGAHAMAKAAILAYTRTLARELGPSGITVNAVSPGMTTTEFTNSLPDQERNAVSARTPLRRLASPDDIAGAVVFFCSPLADFITGSNLAPDGGLAVL